MSAAHSVAFDPIPILRIVFRSAPDAAEWTPGPRLAV